MREFLSTRRDRITPQHAGLPNYGGERRRVPGLRREEVALLAGVSTDYYTRLERGNATGVSDSVVDGVARALQLDEAERNHLYDLIRTSGDSAPPRRGRRRARTYGRRCSVSSTRCTPLLRLCPTADSTSCTRTRSAGPCSRRCSRSPIRIDRRTAPDSCSSTRPPRTCTACGTPSQTTPSPSYARRRGATRTTGSCQSSSASCRCAAPSFGPDGQRTTFASTPQA